MATKLLVKRKNLEPSENVTKKRRMDPEIVKYEKLEEMKRNFYKMDSNLFL